MIHLYTLLVAASAPLLFLAFIWRFGLRRTVRGFGERMGQVPLREAGDERPVLWVHAASVGEVRAVEPLLRAGAERLPGHAVHLTTTTEAGRDMARRLKLADRVTLAPLDLPACAVRFLRGVKPAAVLVMETELWPHWIKTLQRAGVPVLLLNGRMSNRTERFYRLFRFFWGPLLNSFHRIGAQSPRHAARFRNAGADAARVTVTGNLKFDRPLPDLGDRPRLFKRFGFNDADRILVCGSVHDEEADFLVPAVSRLSIDFPDVKFVLAPRHVEAADLYAARLGDAGLSCRRRTDGGSESARVMLLDTVGELADLYTVGAWAYVGGSFSGRRGGQNPLEPARWGVPLIFGPHMENFTEMADLFLANEAALSVAGPAGFARALAALMADAERAALMGAAARRTAAGQAGALDRSLALIGEVFAADPAKAAL